MVDTFAWELKRWFILTVFLTCKFNLISFLKYLIKLNKMSAKRAAGLVIFRNINQSIQFLLLQTSYGEHHWTPPKGHVDPGESDWVTALRETQEEAGITENDLEIYKDINKTLNYNVNGKPKVVVYWLARLKNPGQEVILSHEHQDMKWLGLDKAQEISGFDDMKILLKQFYEKAAGL